MPALSTYFFRYRSRTAWRPFVSPDGEINVASSAYTEQKAGRSPRFQAADCSRRRVPISTSGADAEAALATPARRQARTAPLMRDASPDLPRVPAVEQRREVTLSLLRGD